MTGVNVSNWDVIERGPSDDGLRPAPDNLLYDSATRSDNIVRTENQAHAYLTTSQYLPKTQNLS